MNWAEPSMLTGTLQLVPLKVKAFPRVSTAAQNVVLGQDTDPNALVLLMFTGAVQVEPL